MGSFRVKAEWHSKCAVLICFFEIDFGKFVKRQGVALGRLRTVFQTKELEVKFVKTGELESDLRHLERKGKAPAGGRGFGFTSYLYCCRSRVSFGQISFCDNSILVCGLGAFQTAWGVDRIGRAGRSEGLKRNGQRIAPLAGDSTSSYFDLVSGSGQCHRLR